MKGIARSTPTLSSKQERGIVALLEHTKLKDAAAAVGVSETTLWRWLQDKNFHTAYLKARRDAVQQAIARLQSYTSEAVETLREIMTNTDALDFARLGAARAILDYSIKGIEIEDYEHRLAEIERQLASRTEERDK